jgi:hypothetical protein
LTPPTSAILHSYLWLPSAAGYLVVIGGGLAAGLAMYWLLRGYYLAVQGTGSMGELLSVARTYLGYRRRGWVLGATILAMPAGFLIGLKIAPAAAGHEGLAATYGTFLQTIAGALVALLVVIAVQTRFASRKARFATREAGVVAVLWVLLGELGAIAAMSPGLPGSLQRPSFGLMCGGALSGAVALVFIAGWTEVEEGEEEA